MVIYNPGRSNKNNGAGANRVVREDGKELFVTHIQSRISPDQVGDLDH